MLLLLAVGWHAAILGGFGTSQGLAGGRLEVRSGNVAIFAGTGALMSVTLDGDSFGGGGYGAVAGLRAFLRDSGDGPFLSAQFSFSTQQVPGDPLEHFDPYWKHQNATTLVAGWRWRFGSGLLLEAGAGGGVLVRDHATSLMPDVDLALGWEF
jgi:hypothetical protein